MSVATRLFCLGSFAKESVIKIKTDCICLHGCVCLCEGLRSCVCGAGVHVCVHVCVGSWVCIYACLSVYSYV